MRQKDVAELIGVSPFTVLHWEQGKTSIIPERFLPALFDLLGYDPRGVPEAKTLSERLVAWRTARGLSKKQAAKELKIDEVTFAQWEHGVPVKQKRHGELLRGIGVLGLETR